MESQSKPLSVLLSGRIYEEDEVFIIIQKIVKRLLSYSTSTLFFFMDEKTMKKIFSISPSTKCFLFSPTVNLDYVITVGGDGTILYTAK